MIALPPLSDIDWYNPILPVADNANFNAWVGDFMYEPLLTINGSGGIDYADSVAKSVTANTAGTVFTVHMNPAYHWSDGKPVTSQDVLFCWDIIKYASSSAAPAPWPYTFAGEGDMPAGVKSVKATGTYSFQVTLDSSANALWFEYNGLSQLIPVPKHAWDKYPSDMAKELSYLTENAHNPSFFKVVDGAFRMKSAVNNSAWTFVPNPRFGGHKASLSELILAYETSDQSEEAQLQEGYVQVGYIDQAELGDQSHLARDKLVTGYGDGFSRILLDYGNPTVGRILDQLPVRQAMAMGIDQTAMIKDIYDGYAVYGAGPVPYSQPSLLAPSLRKPAYPFNPVKGKSVLENAGYHMLGGAMTNAKGQKLSFVMQYESGDPETLSIVQLIQADWAKEGIKVTLDPVPFATMLTLHSNASKWEIQAGIPWTWGGEYPSGEGVFETGGAFNFYKFSNPTLDQLIKASVKPYATTAQSVAALRAFEVYVSKLQPQLWMPYPATLDEVSRNLKGVNANTVNLFTDNFEPQYWSVSQ